MSLTKRFVDQRIQKAREKDAKDTELRRMLVSHSILAGHTTSEQRVEGMRRCRSEAAISREVHNDLTFVRGEQDKERRTRIADAEEKLADEIARRHAEDARKEMERLRMLNGSEEIRALKERLHAAKVSKDRAQQLLDQQARKEREKLIEHKIDEHMLNGRLDEIELEHRLELEKMKQRERVKLINQRQIAAKEEQRNIAHAEYLKEQNEVAVLVAKVEKEDAEEKAARSQKQQESKQMLRQFVIEQQEKQAAMEADEVEENRRIEQYAADKRAREEQLILEKERVAHEKKRMQMRMIGQLEAKSKAKEELEQLRNDLTMDEAEEELRRKEEVEVRKKLEDKEEMRKACQLQKEIQDKKKELARQEEEKLAAALLQKFAEDDRIEQMNEQKRRMKVAEHKREANRLVAVRKEMYEQQREGERKEEEKLHSEEKVRHIVIEAERQRLLREHASELRDFLPGGTLSHPDDAALLLSP